MLVSKKDMPLSELIHSYYEHDSHRRSSRCTPLDNILKNIRIPHPAPSYHPTQKIKRQHWSITMVLLMQQHNHAKLLFNAKSRLKCRRPLQSSPLSLSWIQQQQQQTSLQYRPYDTTKRSSSSSSSSSYRPPVYTSHIKELMSIPQGQYEPPPLPFETSVTSIPSISLQQQDDEDSSPTSTTTTTIASSEATSSGKDFMIQHTYNDNDKDRHVFLNHGSFGAALKCGYDRAQEWRYYLEQQPLRYFDRDLIPHLIHSNRCMADFVNAPTTSSEGCSMTLLQNSTTAFNAIIGGYVREDSSNNKDGGRKIIFWDMTYGNTKNMIHHYCASSPASSNSDELVEIPFQSKYLHRLSKTAEQEENPEDIFIEAIDHELSKRGRHYHDPRRYWENSLLVLDHITSDTAIHVPIEAIAKYVKEQWGMLVAVDGAHGLLSQNLNMQHFCNIDFYVSNGHKWLSCPRGVAMLYCPHEELQDSILRYPPVISHGINDGYTSRFIWDGCRDYAAELALPTVLEYWNQIDGRGPEAVRTLLRKKLKKGVDLLAQMWHPHDHNNNVTLVPMELHSTTMALVRLPEPYHQHQHQHEIPPIKERTPADAKDIQEYLYNENIEVPIKCINGILYVRVSCHLYNTMDDFERLGYAIQKMPSNQ